MLGLLAYKFVTVTEREFLITFQLLGFCLVGLQFSRWHTFFTKISIKTFTVIIESAFSSEENLWQYWHHMILIRLPATLTAFSRFGTIPSCDRQTD